MTSCSLTRIRGLLRVRVANEEYRSSYRSFEVSPSISLLSRNDTVLLADRAARARALCREQDHRREPVAPVSAAVRARLCSPALRHRVWRAPAPPRRECPPYH